MGAPLLQAKTPCEIEGRNFRRGYREPAIGKVYTIQFEVDKETWDACELVPKTALIKGVLWWEQETAEQVAQPEPKRKEPAGPYAYYWERMCKHNVKTWPELQELLDCTYEQVWDCLHKAFEVETMADVSPRQWEAWVNANGLPENLITMSRKSEVEALEKMERIAS